MATWASRRKFMYRGSITTIILVIVFTVFFSLYYKAPTCSDGKQNGREQGVDCGGSCVRLCQSAFLPARIGWGGGKFEKVADGLYNVASYIVNPNTNGAAINVPYKFSLFDNQGVLITERQGTVMLPAHRNALAFEPTLDTGKRVPAKATFEFLAAPQWFKSHDALDSLAILDKKYNEYENGDDENTSSLEVTLENKSLFPYKNIGVAVVLYDADANAIGFSRTRVDVVNPGGGREIAPFTWPFARQDRVVSIEVLPSIAPPHD